MLNRFYWMPFLILNPDPLDVAVDVYHDKIRGQLIGRSLPIGIDLDHLSGLTGADRDVVPEVIPQFNIWLYGRRVDHFEGFTINLDKLVESLYETAS